MDRENLAAAGSCGATVEMRVVFPPVRFSVADAANLPPTPDLAGEPKEIDVCTAVKGMVRSLSATEGPPADASAAGEAGGTV